jgi:hypothetical protein
MNRPTVSTSRACGEEATTIAAEVCREIDSGIADYNRAVREIDEKFRAKNMQTVGAGGLTSIAFLWPSLAPFIGTALPFAVAAKFGWDTWDKYKDAD